MMKRLQECENELLDYCARKAELLYQLNKSIEIIMKLENTLHSYIDEVGAMRKIMDEKSTVNKNGQSGCKWISIMFYFCIVMVLSVVLSLMGNDHNEGQKYLT